MRVPTCTACTALLCCLGVAATAAVASEDSFSSFSSFSSFRIPQGFLLGAGTSAYQTEGAAKEDGKGQSVLDLVYSQDGERPFLAGQNAEISSDSYHHMDEDIAIIRQLKLNAYRFSIAWSRILPNGDLSVVNQVGVNYYRRLLDKLRAINVEPVVTLLHFDYPFNDGFLYTWRSPQLAGHFANYSRVAFQNFGDKVKYWITVNQMDVICSLFNPLIEEFTAPLRPGAEPVDIAVGMYQCIRNHFLGHAQAYRIYKTEFAHHKGQVGLALNPTFARPSSTRYEDMQAAIRYNTFKFGLFLDPLLTGDYHPLVKDQLQRKSIQEGRNTSRLPAFTATEKRDIANSLDFLGLNIYFGARVSARPARPARAYPNQLEVDADVLSDSDPVGAILSNKMDNFDFYTRDDSWVMRESLLYVRDNYPLLPVIISENGYESSSDTIHDIERERYFSHYMREMVRTINEDNVNVFGYIAWSLIDSFEWINGYERRMGLVRVDFTSPSRPRTPRDSCRFFAKLLSEGVVPLPSRGSCLVPTLLTTPIALSLFTCVYLLSNIILL